MADIPMTRAMEDFLINPTIATEDTKLTRRSMGSYRTIVPPHEMFSFKPGKKTPEPAGTIRDFADEPLSWYHSEEEVASPIDADDMSFRSSPSSNGSRHSEESVGSFVTSFPEELAQTCNKVEQQCARAKAVKLVQVGKPKVISMPKLVDIPATPRLKRPATNTFIRPPVSRMSKIDLGSQSSAQSSRAGSPRSSSEKSPVSTAPSSVVEIPSRIKSVRQRPSLPVLHSTPPTQSSPATYTPPGYAYTPATRQQPARFLNHDPFPSTPSEQTMTPTSPSKRRLHKFSSSLALNVFGRSLKRNNSIEGDGPSSPDFDALKEPEPVLFSSRFTEPQTHVVSQICTKGRMVPRGANERAPPLVLPPCPEDYEDEKDHATLSHWPARKDSAVRVEQMNRTPRLHRRQRSMSAAMVTAQA